MDITPPRAGKGAESLKELNRRTEIKQTGQVAPYPRIESSEERREPRPPLLPERRKQQRRIEERRKMDMETAYDTRSHEERRKLKRRAADRRLDERDSEDASSAEDRPVMHIDEEV